MLVLQGVRLTIGCARRERGACPVNSNSTLSGRPMSRLSTIRASKKARACRGASKTIVWEVSICRIDSSHQYPKVRSYSVNGTGRSSIHRVKKSWICSGPSRSQIACSRSGSAQVANPLDRAVNPMPAAAAWRLAHSCPLTQTFNG